MVSARLRIGEVSQRTGLSVVTIRRYEELGLLATPARIRGGFRMYSEADVGRLTLLQGMRPLDFTVEEKLGLLNAFDGLDDPGATDAERAAYRDRLAMYLDAVTHRIEAFRAQLGAAGDFAGVLSDRLTSDTASPGPGPALDPRTMGPW